MMLRCAKQNSNLNEEKYDGINTGNIKKENKSMNGVTIE